MRDVYGATDPRAQWLRFHTQTAGVSLTAQQPDNNVVRTAVEALAAVLGGTNSLHTNALDEVLALPSEKSAQIALRTQQVIMEETGVVNVADPLGGSWYVEALTDRMEAEAERIFTRIKDLAALAVPSGRHPIGEMTSGILRGIEDGYFTGEIADAAFAYTMAVEKGEKKMVGVNSRIGGIGDDLEILRISGRGGDRSRTSCWPGAGPPATPHVVRARLDALVGVARGSGNMIPAMLAGRAGGGDPGRDLRRVAGGVGHLHRAGADLIPQLIRDLRPFHPYRPERDAGTRLAWR